MAYVETSVTGWGQRIANSIKGIFVGLALFLLSFWVLWMNEGRTDMSEVAKKLSVAISPDAVSSASEGKFVSITDTLKSEEQIGDPDFLQTGRYISLQRNAEMYAWVEKAETETKKKVGGGEERVTTYTYEKQWTSDPRPASDFKEPTDHQNPAMKYQSQEFHVQTAAVGAYPIDMQSIRLPGGKRLVLNAGIVTFPPATIQENYLFFGKGNLQQPQLGDMRIHFEALNQGINVTAFGKVEQARLVPFVYKEKNTLYRVLEGTRDEAIATMHFEFKAITWLLRAGGFLMMWFGLSMLFGPVTTFLDVLPFVGTASRWVVRFFMFGVAFVLSLVTMVISMVVHSLIAVIVITVALLVLIGVWLVKHKQKAAQTA